MKLNELQNYLMPGAQRKLKLKSDVLGEMDLIINPTDINTVRDILKTQDNHDVQMAKSDLLQCVQNGMKVLHIMKSMNDSDNLEAWVQEKIIKASDYLNTIREYLEGRMAQSHFQFGEEVTHKLKEAIPTDFKVGQKVIYKYSGGDGKEIPAVVTAVDFDGEAVKIKSLDNKPFPNSGGDIETVVDPGWRVLTPMQRVDPKSLVAATSIAETSLEEKLKLAKDRLVSEVYDGEPDEYHVLRHQTKFDIEREMLPKAWTRVKQFDSYQAARKEYEVMKAKYPNDKFTITTHKKKQEQMSEESQLDVKTPRLSDIAKKHKVSSGELLSQLRKGIKVELEHTSDLEVAKEIALDHLSEFPDYYEKLERVETSEEMMTEAEKDACYRKVKSRYKIWPSAYASGALVKCRKVGAKNWGNKKKASESVAEGSDKLQGTPVVSLSDFSDKDTKKDKYGRTVPKKLKKDDPRVKFYNDKKQGVAEGSLNESSTVNFVRDLIDEFNDQMGGTRYEPMDYEGPGSRVWTRGDGSRYRDPGHIFINRNLEPEDQQKWQKTNAIKKFWQFLSTKGARKIGDVSGEFGSDPHSPAVVLGKLIFVFDGKRIAWGSTSRLKNSSVWRQKKQQGVTEGQYKSQYPTKEEAIVYAKEQVKKFRDPLDGIEIYEMPDGGADIVHTMNSNGREHAVKNGGKKIGTVYQKKDVAEEVDTGHADARKSTPSSKEEQDKVFNKHRDRVQKLKKELDKEKK